MPMDACLCNARRPATSLLHLPFLPLGHVPSETSSLSSSWVGASELPEIIVSHDSSSLPPQVAAVCGFHIVGVANDLSQQHLQFHHAL